MNYVLTPAAVRKLRRALAATPGNGGATGAPSPVSPDDFPPPFTVRWSQSEANGQGAVVIWIPDHTRLVFYNGAWQTITGITGTQTLPFGWVKLSSYANPTTVYLYIIDIPDQYGVHQITCGLREVDYSGVTGCVFCAKVAEIVTDSDTGAKRVKQYIDSTVEIGSVVGGGSSVTPDDISTDLNDDDEVQIKDWDTGTPAAATTIAQDINAGNVTAQSSLPSRTTGGVLGYKAPGTLQQLLGSSVSLSSQKILTGLSWNTTTHKLVISSVTVSIANGVITSWTNNPDEMISTTPISSIVS